MQRIFDKTRYFPSESQLSKIRVESRLQGFHCALEKKFTAHRAPKLVMSSSSVFDKSEKNILVRLPSGSGEFRFQVTLSSRVGVGKEMGESSRLQIGHLFVTNFFSTTIA